MDTCRIKGTASVVDVLDFDEQPICHRFLTDPEQAERTHRLAVGVCERTGLVQLVDPAPGQQLKPIYPWIFYNEPERHLDHVADVLASLPDLKKDDFLFGVSYKDETTLRRLSERGFSRTACADLKEDYGILEAGGGVETIQTRLTRTVAQDIVRRRGKARLVIMRHILEHCYDVPEAIAAIRELVAADGYVVFEMPDATRALEHLDYTTLWEEHIFYFTPATLRGALEGLGFTVDYLHSYHYSHENSLVAVVRPRPETRVTAGSDPSTILEEIHRARRFLGNFDPTRRQVAGHLRDFAARRGGIAFLGAGHLTCSFINIMGLADVVRFVVDDDPNKAGKFMPGSRLPILPSRALLEQDVKLCLFSVRPEIEEAVVRKNQAFLDRGGRMASIFPKSPFAYPFADEPAARAAA